MFCKQCGSPISENDKFCKNCGMAIVPPTQGNANAVPNPATNVSFNENSTNMTTPSNNTGMTQNMNNGNFNTQPWMNNYNIPQKKNYTPYFIAGVVIVVILIFVVAALIAGNNKEDNNTTTNDQTTTPTFTSNTYKVKVGNYTYEISDDLIYSVSGEYLEIGDAENTWVTRMAVEEGSFATVENRMSQLESYFEQRGATSESAQKQTINGVEYITIEVSFNGANYLCAYAAVDATHVVYMMIYDLYNEHNYDVLDVLAPTVSSIKYSNTSVGIETSDNMDLSILESFINKV